MRTPILCPRFGDGKSVVAHGRQGSRRRGGSGVCRSENAKGSSGARCRGCDALVTAPGQADGRRSPREAVCFIRKLLPQDLQIEIEQLTVPDAMKAIGALPLYAFSRMWRKCGIKLWQWNNFSLRLLDLVYLATVTGASLGYHLADSNVGSFVLRTLAR